MKSPLNRFNAIAEIYDVLAAIVFGKAIRLAQCYFLKQIPEKSEVLIVGGGTGWIGKELLATVPGCRLVYIEASDKMLLKSRQVMKHYISQVEFIHGTEESIPTDKHFDAVITNFLLDLFPAESLPHVIRHIKNHLKTNGLWFVTDFVNQGKWWQRSLLKIMYTFFRIVARIQANGLPDWKNYLERSGLKIVKQKNFCFGFIWATVYEPSAQQYPYLTVG